jgi:hypothetical protein
MSVLVTAQGHSADHAGCDQTVDITFIGAGNDAIEEPSVPDAQHVDNTQAEEAGRLSPRMGVD